MEYNFNSVIMPCKRITLKNGTDINLHKSLCLTLDNDLIFIYKYFENNKLKEGTVDILEINNEIPKYNYGYFDNTTLNIAKYLENYKCN